MSETNTEEHRSWWLVWLVWACGAAGAAQVGKVPPALPGMIDSLGISLTLSGWIASTVSLIGIGIGVFAGRLSDRLGARNTISLGLLVISAGCMLGTTATTASWLIATRILEGAGLVMVMASAPTLMQRHAPAGQISMAMGIWGTFMPFGVASILLIAPFIIGGPGWQTLWQLAGVWALTTGAFAWSFLQPDPATKERSPLLADIQSILLRPAILVSGGCFALYAAIYLGVLSFIPVWLTETENLSLGWASTIAALFACCNILGNLTAGALIRRGWKPHQLMRAAALIMGVMALVMFQENVSLGVISLAAVLYSSSGGIIPASTFALIEQQTPRPSLMGTSNGMVLQLLFLGQLLGPPGLAATVSLMGGWTAAPLMLTTLAGIALLMTFWLARIIR